MWRTGVKRGWTENMQMIKDKKELVTQLVGTVGIFMVLLLWMGDEEVKGTDVSVGTFMTAGFLAFTVFSAGLVTLPMTISGDREDGTLLRLRVLPRGIPVYLIGRTVTLLCQITLQCALVLAAGMAFGGVSLPHLPTAAWVLALGTLAVAPMGVALGCVLPGPKNAGAILGLPMMILMIVSGVMIPVAALPEVAQWVAQAFPLYWQGLGLRSAFLPDSVLVSEIGDSWRPAMTAAVLGGWAIAGMLLAPVLLARATRRESGSRLAERRLASQAT
jgi:ABC-2 type transport system permease protein